MSDLFEIEPTLDSVKSQISAILPYKITKKISKTGEARSGAGIYKKRNSRCYRVLIQYETWKKIINGNDILETYSEGYAILIKPKDYFGSNFPNPSTDLDSRFHIGQTGFLLYTTVEELKTYPIKQEWIDKYHLNNFDLTSFQTWKDVLELTTKGSLTTTTWIGEYCLNVRNTKPQYLSYICKSKDAKSKEPEKTAEILHFIEQNYPDYFDNFPAQCGLGNYEYDYASDEMILDVKLQMLYLILCSRSNSNIEFGDFIKSNYESIKDNEDSAGFKSNIKQADYESKFRKFKSDLKSLCESRNLLNFESLKKIGAWSIELNRPVCPLCLSEIHSEEFFTEILQEEGRQVEDNTQREIVLMHINALRPGIFNHKTYNLGWGHNFCNTVQGDKNIVETIEEIKKILERRNAAH